MYIVYTVVTIRLGKSDFITKNLKLEAGNTGVYHIGSYSLLEADIYIVIYLFDVNIAHTYVLSFYLTKSNSKSILILI